MHISSCVTELETCEKQHVVIKIRKRVKYICKIIALECKQEILKNVLIK